MSGCSCIRWLDATGSTAYSFQRIMLRRVQTASVVYGGVFMYSLPGWQPVLRHTPSSGLCSGVGRQPQWVYGGVFMYSLPGWELCPSCGLCTGVYRQPQWVYVGGVYVFIGRVHPVLRSELYLIIHAEMPLRLFMDFSAGSLCIFNRNITASQEKLYLILRAALSPT